MSDTITAEDLASREDRTVIDVRTPDEFRQEHVPGAIDVPLEQLGQRIGELPEARPLVLICASGHRSARGADLLTERGVPAVSVEGGLEAWKAAGLPVESGPAAA